MNKKILYIVLIVLGALLLLGLLWWWFLGRTSVPPGTQGTFGSGQDKTQNIGGESGSATNIPGEVPRIETTRGTAVSIKGSIDPKTTVGGTSPNTSQTGTDGSDSSSSGVSTVGSVTSSLGQIGVPGVTWLSGSTTGTGTGRGFFSPAGTVFNPTGIISIDSSDPSGGVLPNIGGSFNGGGGGGIGIGGLALVAVGIGAITCSGVIGAVLALAGGVAAVEGPTLTALAASELVNPLTVKVSLPVGSVILAGIGVKMGVTTALAIGDEKVDFLSCIARTIAKVAIQQITISVVNWINSGFTGSPSFVTNPTAFFANVADNAAGQFIRGSQLAFLCSPFQLQVKIAIAQSYANRHAQFCSLSRVVSNMKGFMNGNFSQGGWPGIISMTAAPTNNPYGANLYGTIGIHLAVNTAVGQKQIDLLQGRGFLSFTKNMNCKPGSTAVTGPGKSSKAVATDATTGGVIYDNCDVITQTPGAAIAGAVDKTLGIGHDSLNLAKSFDEIINALISQLMVQALQGGLLGLSGQNGYQSNYMSPEESQAQAAAQVLLMAMQSDTGLSQSYAGLQQGSISDIQNAQFQLNNLANCWAGYETSTLALTQQQRDLAANNASSTRGAILTLNIRVDIYNSEITRANSSIATLESLQSRALSAASTAETTAITQSYNTAKTSGLIITSADFTTAQQNRTTLQSEMSALNQQTATRLTQCYAFQN